MSVGITRRIVGSVDITGAEGENLPSLGQIIAAFHELRGFHTVPDSAEVSSLSVDYPTSYRATWSIRITWAAEVAPTPPSAVRAPGSQKGTTMSEQPAEATPDEAAEVETTEATPDADEATEDDTDAAEAVEGTEV